MQLTQIHISSCQSFPSFYEIDCCSKTCQKRKTRGRRPILNQQLWRVIYLFGKLVAAIYFSECGSSYSL